MGYSSNNILKIFKVWLLLLALTKKKKRLEKMIGMNSSTKKYIGDIQSKI